MTGQINDERSLHALLAYLAVGAGNGRYRQWQFHRVGGGANNILYRVQSDHVEFAVKFTIRDERRRAWREFQALKALQQAGLSLAPVPILLDEENYSQPVVVQSWEAGQVTAEPPQSDAEWEALIAYYAVLANVGLDSATVTLRPAMVNFTSPAAGLVHIQTQLNRIPTSAHPPQIAALLAALELLVKRPFSPPYALTLCRNDANYRNFIHRPDGLLSVDWENSGWGDPAFEVVELITHIAYLDVERGRWAWVMQRYGEMVADETAVSRMHHYLPFMLVWWVVRMARYLYEVPRGHDQRLVAGPDDWEAWHRSQQAKLARYVAWATAVLEEESGRRLAA